MKEFNIALTDKVIKPYLDGKTYLDVSNENEAIGIAGGYWLATKKRANVYISADGFCNALNFFTSWVMPEGIEMNIYISSGRTEPPHIVMTEVLPELLELLNYDTKKILIEVIYKK